MTIPLHLDTSDRIMFAVYPTVLPVYLWLNRRTRDPHPTPLIGFVIVTWIIGMVAWMEVLVRVYSP